MSWLNNPVINWGNKKKRRKNLLLLLNSNPVWNGAVDRIIGDKIKVTEQITDICRLRFRQYENIPDASTNELLHSILLKDITMILIKNHISEMLKDESPADKELVEPGKVHYPPHYFVSRIREDNSIEFFLKDNKEDIYAQFYDETTAFSRTLGPGESVKLSRPAVVIDNKNFPKVWAIPISKSPKNETFVEIKLIPPTPYIEQTFAIVSFKFIATKTMMHGGFIKDISLKHLKDINNARSKLKNRF